MNKYRFFTLALALAVSTAAFHSPAQAEPVPGKADPQAYQLLKKAHEARQTLPDNFPGFDATLVYQEGDKTLSGSLNYRSNSKPILNIKGLSTSDLEWLKHQARSFITHRTDSDFDTTTGRYPLRFGKSEATGFGTLIEYNDPKRLTSRVRDNSSLELLRTAGDKRFYISVLENTECDPGKFIPTRYVVSYFDPQTHVLQAVNIFENSYAKFDNYWLPTARKVVTIDHVLGDGLRIRSFQFTDIKLAQP